MADLIRTTTSSIVKATLNPNKWKKNSSNKSSNQFPSKAKYKSSKVKPTSEMGSSYHCKDQSFNTFLDMANNIFSNKTNYFDEAAKVVFGDLSSSVDSETNFEANWPCDAPDCTLLLEERKEIFILSLQTIKSLNFTNEVKSSASTNLRHTETSLNKINYIELIEQILDISHEDSLVWQQSDNSLLIKYITFTIEEAKDLLGSDSDGKSDPYCRCGIVTSDHFNSAHKSKTKLVEMLKNDDLIETSVRPSTCFPLWKETFSFKVTEKHVGIIVEVWDSDDIIYERSKFTPAIKSVKYMIKDQFNPGQDDFLGKCMINFSNISAEQSSLWYKLTSSSGKYGRGEIHMSIKFESKLDEITFSELYDRNNKGIKIYEKFLIEAARHSIKTNNSFKNGDLPEDVLTLSRFIPKLLQLTEFENVIAQIPLIANYLIKKTYSSYKLCNVLLVLSTSWQERIHNFPVERIKSLISSLYGIYEHQLELIERTRIIFPPTCEKSINCLTSVLKGLQQNFNFLKIARRIPDDVVLTEVLKVRVINDVTNWMELEIEKAQPLTTKVAVEDQAKVLTDVCDSAAHYLANSWAFYQVPFKKTGLIYFDVAFIRLDYLLTSKILHYLTKYDVMRKFTIDYFIPNVEEEIEKVANGSLAIFRLYQAVADVYSLHSNVTNGNLLNWELSNYTNWFKPCVLTWLDITRSLTINNLDRVLDADDGLMYETTENIKVTSSAVDTSICFEQCYQFYDLLNWNSPEDQFNFSVKLTLMACDIAKHYTNSLHDNLSRCLETIDTSPVATFSMNEALCLKLNNAFLIHSYIKDIRFRMDWNAIDKGFDETIEMIQAPSHTLETIISGCIEDLYNIELRMLHSMGIYFYRVFRNRFNSFIQLPFGIESETGIDCLMVWLVNNIETACNTLSDEYFNYLLKEFWGMVMKTFREFKEDRIRCSGQYERIYFGLEEIFNVFYCEGEGLTKEYLKSLDFISIHEHFHLYKDETQNLILRYYKELANACETEVANYGTLTFSVAFITSIKKLDIFIIKADSLPKMDIVGSCDPYIEANIISEGNNIRTKTKTHRNTQDPFFNEELELKITEKQIKDDVLQLSLYDYDRYTQDDYCGSVYVDLCKVPTILDINSDNEGLSKPRQMSFIFPNDSSILAVLDERSSDKSAVQFLKYIHSLQSLKSKIHSTLPKSSPLISHNFSSRKKISIVKKKS